MGSSLQNPPVSHSPWAASRDMRLLEWRVSVAKQQEHTSIQVSAILMQCKRELQEGSDLFQSYLEVANQILSVL